MFVACISVVVYVSLSAICMHVAVYVTMQRRGKKSSRAELDGWMDGLREKSARRTRRRTRRQMGKKDEEERRTFRRDNHIAFTKNKKIKDAHLRPWAHLAIGGIGLSG